MTSNRKLLLIGVDAGSPDLFERWTQSGDMPNLAELFRTGLSGRVRNPYALEAGSAWPVFHSGLLPGHQPQYDGRRVFDPDTYSHRWYELDETPPPFWRQLGDQGLRCLLIDPPYVRLDPRINGTMIIDWGAHVPADGKRFQLSTHPESVADEILESVGPDPANGVSCDRMAPESIADFARFRDTYLQRIERRGTLARKMLTEKVWDFALVVSPDLHCTGHQLWHVNDRRHPDYRPELEAALGEPIRDCYRAFDESLGRILEAVDDVTTVMVLGSHGMGPQHTGTGLLDRILVRLEEGRPAKRDHSFKSDLRRLWHRVPVSVRARLRLLRKPFQGSLHPPVFLGNRPGRRYFEVYANNASGGVRINLRGREANGLVEPDQFDAMLRHLKKELQSVVNVDTGEPLIADIIVAREHYDGPYLDRLPDLLICWNRKAPIHRVQSEAIGILAQELVTTRTGDHTPDGVFVVRDSRRQSPGTFGEVAAQDFAPTIAEFFGLQLAAHDGTSFGLAHALQSDPLHS